MHQDIQNFSQIMDIDTSKKLSISVKLKIHRNPNFKFYVNDIDCITNNFSLTFDLLDSINFHYVNLGGDGAVEIENISINGHEIMPLYLNKANPPINWLENIDFWKFNVPSPFYAWYQGITGNGEIF